MPAIMVYAWRLRPLFLCGSLNSVNHLIAPDRIVLTSRQPCLHAGSAISLRSCQSDDNARDGPTCMPAYSMSPSSVCAGLCAAVLMIGYTT